MDSTTPVPQRLVGAHGGRATAPAPQPAVGPCPSSGPLVLFVIWDLVVRFGLIKPIPAAAAGHPGHALRQPGRRPAARNFAVTVWLTVQASSSPPSSACRSGVLLGSNEDLPQRRVLIDFFRSTPSSALIPLFLLIFGVSDINKVAIAAFGAFLIVVFNSAYGVINARKQRVMAAR